MNVNTSAVLAAAIQEIEERRLGLTAQFLTVHGIRRENGRPVVPLMEPVANSMWDVTFEVEGAPYYWTLTLKQDGDVVVPFTALSRPAAIVDFVVSSRVVDPDSASQLLGLVPSKVRVMGQPRPGGRTHYPHHEWCYVPDLPAASRSEDKVERILTDLLGVKDQLMTIADEIEAQLRVWHEGYKDHANFAVLTREQVSKLASLNASYLFNCVLSGPDLPEG